MRWRAQAFQILSLALALVTPSASAGDVVLRVSEGWKPTRIVADAPQTPILEFGDQYALSTGELVFWGRSAGGWTLYSLRDDRLRAILAEGEKSVSRYGEPGVQLHLHYQGDGLLHRATRIFAGKVVVLSTEQKISLGGSVYAWDGDRLRSVLVEGERTTLGGGGVVAGGFAWAASPDGQVLLTLRTKKPDPYSAWAVYDGSALRLLARSGEPLPGLPELRVGELCSGGSGGACEIPLFEGGRVLAALALERGGVPTSAIVSLAPGGNEVLVSRGDPFPGDPAKTIDTLRILSAESPHRYVALLFAQDPSWQGGERQATYARCDGRICTPTKDEVAKPVNVDETPVPWPSARSLRWRDQWRQDGNTRIGRLDLYAVLPDGATLQLTPPSLLLDSAALRVVEGGIPGAIIEGSYWDNKADEHVYVDTRKLGVRSHPGRWFVAADDLAAGFQPVPTLRTADGKNVSLADVLVRNGDRRQVIAQLDDGIYRLEKSAEQTP